MDLMSTAQILGSFGEFFGAIAVVVTLIYLAYQVRQTRLLAVFQTVQASRDHRIQLFRDQRDSKYFASTMTKLRQGESLSAEDRARWNGHLSLLWAMTYSEWVQNDLGLTAGYGLNAYGTQLAMRAPGAMEWWDSFGDQIYPREFVVFVEELRSDLP